MRILLVDDDQDDQEVFDEALKMLNGNVFFDWAANAEQAIGKLSVRSELPDYIFLDLNMPKIDGKQLLSMIRSIPYLSETPVYIYTTSRNKKHKDETRLLGATGFITKPADFKELRKELEKILKGSDGRQRLA